MQYSEDLSLRGLKMMQQAEELCCCIFFIEGEVTKRRRFSLSLLALVIMILNNYCKGS